MESKKKESHNHSSWLEQYIGSSRNLHERAWVLWNKYLGDKDELWILAHKEDEDWASHLVGFRRWLKQQRSKKRPERFLSDNTAKTFSNAIRGYFRHIGIILELSKVQRQELIDVEELPEKDYPFNLRAKQQLLQITDEEEEYIISAGVSFGLRIGDFLTITRGMLEPLMNQEIPIQLPPMVTKKKGVKAYPLIDRDAHYAIKRLLLKMNREGRTKPEDRMLLMKDYAVNDRIQILFKKAGINIGQFHIRFHILRKFLTDKLAGTCSGDLWKKFVGKKSTSPYVSNEGREAYKRVMDFTCLNGDTISRGGGVTISKEDAKLLKTFKDILEMYSNMKAQVIRSTMSLGPEIGQYATEDVKSPLLDAVLLAKAFREALKKED